MSGKAKTVENQQMEVSKSTGAVMTAFFGVLSLAFLFPIFLVLVNSFKSKLYIRGAVPVSQSGNVCGPYKLF